MSKISYNLEERRFKRSLAQIYRELLVGPLKPPVEAQRGLKRQPQNPFNH